MVGYDSPSHLKAEGQVRPQAGVKPLLIKGRNKNPEGVTEWPALPSGLSYMPPNMDNIRIAQMLFTIMIHGFAVWQATLVVSYL